MAVVPRAWWRDARRYMNTIADNVAYFALLPMVSGKKRCSFTQVHGRGHGADGMAIDLLFGVGRKDLGST